MRSLAAILCLLLASAASAATVTPAPQGSRATAFSAAPDNLAARGFVEQEFLVNGSATGSNEADAAPEAKPYTTRILVRRPADPARFNGTAIVEWLNVSAGWDLETAWPLVADLAMREGYAYVAVSAQPVGVDCLKRWDGARYGGLDHPGKLLQSPSLVAVESNPGNPCPSYTLKPGATPPATPPFVETFSDAIFADVGRALLQGKAGLRPKLLSPPASRNRRTG